jgi:hypothetical protein
MTTIIILLKRMKYPSQLTRRMKSIQMFLKAQIAVKTTTWKESTIIQGMTGISLEELCLQGDNLLIGIKICFLAIVSLVTILGIEQ